MTSKALERAEALLAADAENAQSASWWFAEARGAARDVVKLAAEVARLEQALEDARYDYQDHLAASFRERDSLATDLAAARARERELREALEEIAGMPYNVIAGNRARATLDDGQAS